MNIYNLIQAQLEHTGLPLSRFQEILHRLLAHGYISRDDDRAEQLLYDDALRIEPVMSDYFDVLGFRLSHNPLYCLYQLYPPGARVDSLPDNELSAVPSLRAKLNVDTVATTLALRFIYQDKSQRGDIEENGVVLISLEELSTTLITHIKRPFPENANSKLAILEELRRWGALSFDANFSISKEDALIAIRPAILGLVNNDVIEVLLENEPIEIEELNEEVVL